MQGWERAINTLCVDAVADPPVNSSHVDAPVYTPSNVDAPVYSLTCRCTCILPHMWMHLYTPSHGDALVYTDSPAPLPAALPPPAFAAAVCPGACPSLRHTPAAASAGAAEGGGAGASDAAAASPAPPLRRHRPAPGQPRGALVPVCTHDVISYNTHDVIIDAAIHRQSAHMTSSATTHVTSSSTAQRTSSATTHMTSSSTLPPSPVCTQDIISYC